MPTPEEIREECDKIRSERAEGWKGGTRDSVPPSKHYHKQVHKLHRMVD